MVECRRLPHSRVVALCTIVTEVPCDVIRIRCLLELRLMALVAIRVVQLVVATGMAGLTLRCNVSTRQREQCCIVIECRIGPICSRVTLSAVMIEIAGDMVR